MQNPSPSLRIAIGQLEMKWTGDENAAAVVRCIALAADRGARLCVFPELAVTGFHRRIAEMAKPDLVGRWLGSIQDACATRGVAASLGAPTFGDDGRIYNSQLFIDAAGSIVGAVEKSGLTPPEATFFARGGARPKLRLGRVLCSAVICREVEDFDDVVADLAPGEAAELIVWPGLMGPSDEIREEDPPRHVRQAQQLAKHLGAHVVQANWPNSLNYPERSATAGKSAVIGPDGGIAFMLPTAAFGVAVFTLGESTFEWLASDDGPAQDGI